MIDGTSEFSRWRQQRALADEQTLCHAVPPSYFQAFSDPAIHNCVSEIMWLLWGGNLLFIQVGVASLVCGGRCLIASCSLMLLALAVQTGTEGFGRPLILYQRGPELD